jgi:hypothetical protein
VGGAAWFPLATGCFVESTTLSEPQALIRIPSRRIGLERGILTGFKHYTVLMGYSN